MKYTSGWNDSGGGDGDDGIGVLVVKIQSRS
jgi:hypothetical protein